MISQKSTRPTVVLVHGAFQDGRSTWRKVRPLLETKGHKIVTVELPGRNGEGTNLHSLTIETYRDQVLNQIQAEEAPVILVCHSFGGMTISSVAEAAPERVLALVYLSAYLPLDGQSLMTLAQGDTDSYLGKPGSLVFSADYSVAQIREDQKAIIFANDAEENDRDEIVKSLVAEPAGPQGMPVRLTDARFGKVSKTYIETTKDHCVSPYLQEKMIAAGSVTKVIKIDAGHASYVTQPRAVADAIMQSVPEPTKVGS